MYFDKVVGSQKWDIFDANSIFCWYLFEQTCVVTSSNDKNTESCKISKELFMKKLLLE
jgi:hypothetical protein